MKYLLTTLFIVYTSFIMSKKDMPVPNIGIIETSTDVQVNDTINIYTEITGNKPPEDVFIKCLNGLKNLNLEADSVINKQLVTIIDFRLSSNMKRLWVIDLNQKKVLYNTLVAHGRNSGNEFACSFSNRPSSNQSSLGFYLTGETYQGKHGLSLFLDGQEEGYNDKARERTVVMHGADYVSSYFIKKYGRLGRSFGCPSIPMEFYKDIINTIKGGTCLFIYYPDLQYENSSVLLNRH